MPINLEDHLDEDHLAVLQMLPGDLLDMSDIVATRAKLDEFMGQMPAPELPATVEVTDHHIDGFDGHQVMVRSYRPAERRENSPGLYWIHGGGMILGSVDMNDVSCAEIAQTLNVVVASVEYRLAPEFPYPVPMEDCYSGLTWFFDQAEAFGLDTSRIAIGGASAFVDARYPGSSLLAAAFLPLALLSFLFSDLSLLFSRVIPWISRWKTRIFSATSGDMGNSSRSKSKDGSSLLASPLSSLSCLLTSSRCLAW